MLNKLLETSPALPSRCWLTTKTDRRNITIIIVVVTTFTFRFTFTTGVTDKIQSHTLHLLQNKKDSDITNCLGSEVLQVIHSTRAIPRKPCTLPALSLQ